MTTLARCAAAPSDVLLLVLLRLCLLSAVLCMLLLCLLLRV